jgi:alpha-D-ribose 1-methylphosphonate 5-triphosphate synthase subunit PhnG
MQGAAAMLQEGDRREWMGLLARAPLALLESWAAREPQRGYSWLRRPESGLVMVRARAGGTGAQFNLGEMTITRCALKLDGGRAGVAYVQGRSHRKAEIAALADALLQSSEAPGVRRGLLEPLRARLEADAAARARKAQSTRVEFFTLARQTAA